MVENDGGKENDDDMEDESSSDSGSRDHKSRIDLEALLPIELLSSFGTIGIPK